MRRTGGSLPVLRRRTAPALTARQPTGFLSASVLALLGRTDDIRTLGVARPAGLGLELVDRVSRVGGDRLADTAGHVPDRLRLPEEAPPESRRWALPARARAAGCGIRT